MKIILRKDIEKLGKAGDVVEVKKGYARNYLLPKGIVFIATPGNLRKVEEEKRMLLKKEKKTKEEASSLAKELQKKSITIPVQVGEKNELYGSVTTQDIANALSHEGFKINKNQIDLPEPIKSLGIYNVAINLHKGISTKVRVWVVKT